MRVLMTGATGFLGRTAVPALTGAGHEVVALGRRAPDPALGAVDFVAADLAEPLDVAALPDADVVVHLAQSEHYRDFPGRAAHVHAVNVDATLALLGHAHRCGATAFVHASSGGVYGSGEGALTEDTQPAPRDFYQRSKLMAELLLDSYAPLLRTVALRYCFIYGAGQERMLIPTLAGRILDGDPIEVVGDPGLRINPIHVRDAARALVAAVDGPAARPVNVAGDEVVSIGELVTRLAAAAGVSADVTHVPAEPAGDLIADTARMHAELGVRPEVGLAEGLAEVAEDVQRRRAAT